MVAYWKFLVIYPIYLFTSFRPRLPVRDKKPQVIHIAMIIFKTKENYKLQIDAKSVKLEDIPLHQSHRKHYLDFF